MATGLPDLTTPPPAQTVLINGDSTPNSNTAASKLWGIYQAQLPIIVPDSIVDVNYKNASRISSYPIEAGTFANYNKVPEPYRAKVRMTKAVGGINGRTRFLSLINSLAIGIQLVDIVTPEITYLNANIVGYDYARTPMHGANIIVVEVELEEIRVTATAIFNNTQAPDGSNPQNTGSIAPQTPTKAYFTSQ